MAGATNATLESTTGVEPKRKGGWARFTNKQTTHLEKQFQIQQFLSQPEKDTLARSKTTKGKDLEEWLWSTFNLLRDHQHLMVIPTCIQLISVEMKLYHACDIHEWPDDPECKHTTGNQSYYDPFRFCDDGKVGEAAAQPVPAEGHAPTVWA